MTEILASLKEWGKCEQKGTFFFTRSLPTQLSRETLQLLENHSTVMNPTGIPPLRHTQLNKASENFQQKPHSLNGLGKSSIYSFFFFSPCISSYSINHIA